MANLVKSVELKILADDGDAEEKIDRISEKADELREKHPELSVRIDTAEANAKLGVFREELKEATKSVKVEIKPDVNKADLAKAEGEMEAAKAGGDAGGGGGFLTTSLFEDAVPGLFSPVGIAAIGTALAALLPELTGVASGFAAAGTGIGAFVALALPSIDKIKNAYTGLHAAQSAYHAAVELEKKDPTSSNLEAEKTALAQLKIAYQSMSPATRQAVGGLDELRTTYGRMAKAFEPDVFKTFNLGLKIANNLLPDLKPFADTAATAIDGLLTKLGKFTQSKGFADWLGQFQKISGPAITAIGEGIGRVASNVGKLLTTMSAKDDVHAINIAFDVLSGTIKGLTGTVSVLMRTWDDTSRIFSDVAKAAEKMAPSVGHAFVSIGHAAADVWNAVHHAFDNVEHAFDNVEHAGDNFSNAIAATLKTVGGFFENLYDSVRQHLSSAVSFVQTIPGKIKGALGSLAGLLLAAGESLISGLLSGIESRAGSVLSYVSGLAGKISSVFRSALSIFSPSKVFMKHGQDIVDGLILGMDGRSGAATAASQRLARNVNSATYGGGAGGRGPQRIMLEFTGGDGDILTAMAHAVRVRGGQPWVLGLKSA